MRPAALPAALLLAASILAAGCASPGTDDDGPGTLGPQTYSMRLSGMPSAPVSGGDTFDVTVQASMGQDMGMVRRTSDHIGAHFWNRTVADPTAGIGNSTACTHRTGDLPGTHSATCTAPLQPGSYRIRAHTRVIENGTTYHWWGDEETFTVA
jgi:hypothetical protein